MFKKISVFLKTPVNPIITISFILSFFLIIFLKSIQYKQEEETKIKTYKGEAIGLTTRFKDCGKNCIVLKYYFYVNNNKITGKIDGRDYNSDVLSKFFKVKFNENNLDESYLFIEEEIKTDSLKITKAGFKYKKCHDLNNSTNTYEEYYKWE